MLLAIDIGNTNITIGLIENENIKLIFRLDTNLMRTEDQYIADFNDILILNKINSQVIKGSIISSVVPSVTNTVVGAVERIFKVKPVLLSLDLNIGIDFKVDDKKSLGPDLIAGCVAAVNHFEEPLIVVDLGTATTMIVINKQKEMIGGCIIPGMKISLDALCKKAALLSEINLEGVGNIIGKNTADCMKSGLIYGTVAMIEGLCEKIEEELGYSCKIIITGGLNSIIAPYFKRKVTIKENLLLDGLRIIYNKLR